ncbi:atp synthase gamma subunit, partial [Nannochloropsis gaditana]
MMRTVVVLSLLLGANAFQAPFLSRVAPGAQSLRSNDFTTTEAFEPSIHPSLSRPRGQSIRMDGKSNAIRGRITSVKSTKKITEAMRLVAAAKVRRAQEAVLSTRPFNEGLQSVFSGLVQRLALENIELPLLQDRPVKSVT